MNAILAFNLKNIKSIGKYIGIMKGNNFSRINFPPIFKKAVVAGGASKNKGVNKAGRRKRTTRNLNTINSVCSPCLVDNLDGEFGYMNACVP